jgi:hypothetical protein
VDDHPAQKLAAAAEAARQADPDALERAIAELKPTNRSKIIAQALAIFLKDNASSGNREILAARLQIQLMEEHVAAQERMGQTISVLTGVLVVLTLLLVVFGFADIADKWTWSWCPWR